MSTKITTANIRIALSYNYSTFEVSAQLENEDGVSVEDIKSARENCQLLATEAMNEYKIQPNSNPKVELEKIKNKLNAIQKMVSGSEPEIVDPKEVAEIEKLPTYEEVKKAKKA